MQKLAAQAYMEGAVAALSTMDIDSSIKQASMDSLYEAAEYLGKGIVNPLGGDDNDYLRSAAGLGTAGLAGYGLYRAATSDAAKRYYDNLGKGVKNVATGNFGDIDKDQAIAMAGTGLGAGALAYGGKKLYEGYGDFVERRANREAELKTQEENNRRAVQEMMESNERRLREREYDERRQDALLDEYMNTREELKQRSLDYYDGGEYALDPNLSVIHRGDRFYNSVYLPKNNIFSNSFVPTPTDILNPAWDDHNILQLQARIDELKDQAREELETIRETPGTRLAALDPGLDLDRVMSTGGLRTRILRKSVSTPDTDSRPFHIDPEDSTYYQNPSSPLWQIISEALPFRSVSSSNVPDYAGEITDDANINKLDDPLEPMYNDAYSMDRLFKAIRGRSGAGELYPIDGYQAAEGAHALDRGATLPFTRNESYDFLEKILPAGVLPRKVGTFNRERFRRDPYYFYEDTFRNYLQDRFGYDALYGEPR